MPYENNQSKHSMIPIISWADIETVASTHIGSLALETEELTEGSGNPFGSNFFELKLTRQYGQIWDAEDRSSVDIDL